MFYSLSKYEPIYSVHRKTYLWFVNIANTLQLINGFVRLGLFSYQTHEHLGIFLVISIIYENFEMFFSYRSSII